MPYAHWMEGCESTLAPNLAGETAVVTGASDGLGVEIARRIGQVSLVCVRVCVRA